MVPVCGVQVLPVCQGDKVTTNPEPGGKSRHGKGGGMNIYLLQRGKYAGYWKRIPFNYDSHVLALRGHITMRVL
jgi:hypothetical protein